MFVECPNSEYLGCDKVLIERRGSVLPKKETIISKKNRQVAFIIEEEEHKSQTYLANQDRALIVLRLAAAAKK